MISYDMGLKCLFDILGYASGKGIVLYAED